MGDMHLMSPMSQEYHYQHLSPLDAFKAKGKYLHSQLRKATGKNDVRNRAQDSRDSYDAMDAFALDEKLRGRKSNYLTVSGSHVAPSIHSEVGQLDELHRSASNSTFASLSSTMTFSSRASTIMPNSIDDSEDTSGSSGSGSSGDHEHSDPNTGRHSHASSVTSISRCTISEAARPVSHTTTPTRSRQSSGQEKHATTTRQPNLYDKRANTPRLASPTSAYETPTSRLLSPMESPRPRDSQDTRPVAVSARALSYGVPSRNSPVASPIDRPSPGARAQSSRSLGRSDTRTQSINNSRIASLPDAKLSAAVHIELGIEQHEANELPQSTHHFRVAADMGDPTGCLLYGLSLRHGWGIRQDLQRSILMLQKAVDTIGVDLDDIRASKLLNAPLTGEVAVAIYELGVSYKNGWGVTVDKKAALKYFELASSWGDVEAMVVAADCYLQGEGCKKDKVKAARYLRRAEREGKKEIGNSWIWKPKYDEE